jgi:hypothetical protein
MFDEDIDDIQEVVVEPQEDKSVVDEDIAQTSEENEEVANPQTDEQNRIYKNMRLRAEDEARKSLEKEREAVNKLKVEAQQALAERKILDEYTSPKKVEEFADARGISDELAREMLTLRANEQINAEKIKVVESFGQVQAKKNELKSKYPQYSTIESEVDEVISKYPNATAFDYENVFYHTVGKRALEISNATQKATEKKVVADMHDRARRKNVGSSDGNSGDIIASTVLSSEGLAMANAFGHDPRDIAKYVKNVKRR